MKTILAVICLSVLCSSSASAQCYGEAAQAFGCGISRGQEDSLESFGDSRNDVLPEHGASRRFSVDDLFTTQEQMAMYRRIVLGGRTNRYVEGTFRNSMNSGARPIRRQGNLPFTGPRF